MGGPSRRGREGDRTTRRLNVGAALSSINWRSRVGWFITPAEYSFGCKRNQGSRWLGRVRPVAGFRQNEICKATAMLDIDRGINGTMTTVVIRRITALVTVCDQAFACALAF